MSKVRRGASIGSCATRVPVDGPAALPVIGQGSLAGVRKSTRGKWRAAVLIGVHAVIALHITHFLLAGRTLSPVEPSESMYTLELGYVNAGFVFFGIALAATLIFGRFFCGWGCHILALQDLCAWLMKKLGVRPRPFRARLLAFAPIVVAFYMFAWPTLRRMIASAGETFPGFSNHFATNEFWATFPGPLFTVLTFAVCGFAAVYFLGSKGFCTYGCPYGGMFGALDYASPGRIVVDDNCEQCGHCTATCTSNVRVHEEVRLYGMVVDPGCMKCTDCISVCPKGALSFGFAKPSMLKRIPKTRPSKRYDLSLAEEILVAAIALVATLVYRDLYNGPPLLLSVGLGGITGFLALKLWQLVRRPGVRVQNLELKAAGRMTRAGAAFAVLTVTWLAFTSHSAFAQWHRAWGRYELDRTEVSREDGLSGVFRSKTYSSRHERALERALHHFTLADRFGMFGVVEVKLGLAWCRVLRGEMDAAANAARQAVALSPESADLTRNVSDIEAAAWAGRFERANAMAESGDLDAAARELAACVAAAPEAAPARFNYGGVLRRLGRNAEAVEQLAIASRLSPSDPDAFVELGLAYKALGRNREAAAAFKAAIALAPDRLESQQYLPELIDELSSSPR